ncbi:hypothetical protein GOV12_02730 [Candidatus Pacearchaeota archaeon]|nr:hypothetical protein [Candidatus Pacearchaeota archaeon]
MNRVLECPESELVELVGRLEAEKYFRLLDKLDTVSSVRNQVIDAPKHCDGDYGFQLRVLDELETDPDLIYMNKLKAYGDTRDEMVEALGEHVLDCGSCMDSYKSLLMERAREDKRIFELEESLEEIARGLNKLYLDVGVEI